VTRMRPTTYQGFGFRLGCIAPRCQPSTSAGLRLPPRPPHCSTHKEADLILILLSLLMLCSHAVLTPTAKPKRPGESCDSNEANDLSRLWIDCMPAKHFRGITFAAKASALLDTQGGRSDFDPSLHAVLTPTAKPKRPGESCDSNVANNLSRLWI
jgi:hypothetical protein